MVNGWTGHVDSRESDIAAGTFGVPLRQKKHRVDVFVHRADIIHPRQRSLEDVHDQVRGIDLVIFVDKYNQANKVPPLKHSGVGFKLFVSLFQMVDNRAPDAIRNLAPNLLRLGQIGNHRVNRPCAKELRPVFSLL